jgi:YesN/AraC family two-component response regulator
MMSPWRARNCGCCSVPSLGVQVVAECQDGQQTIGAVRAHKPDLLLIDVRMPDVDGFEVLAKLTERRDAGGRLYDRL